jgi:type VI secretion system secreted protein Hcp
MASIFMKVPKIDGESKEKNHEKWIELQSCSWSHARTIAAGVKSSQRSRGETFFNDIMVTNMMHKGSMKVQQNAATGTVMDPVEIHFCRTGADPKQGLETYLTIKLSDCMITAYSTGISGEEVPYENLSLNFTKVEMEYKEADSKGELKTASSFTYNKETGSAA